MFSHRAVVSSVPLVIVAAVILLMVRGIGVVTARDTSTRTKSMSTVTRLKGMAACHRDIAATSRKIAAVMRNTRTTTMVGCTNMAVRLTGRAAMANIVAEMKYKGV